MRGRILLLGTLLSFFLSCSDGEVVDLRSQVPLPEGIQRLQTQGSPGGTLRYALPGEVRTFNPLAAQDSRSKLVSGLFSATLLEYDHRTQEIVGGVAGKWETSPDGLVLDLFIRPGLRFGDGTPLSVDDILFTFEEILREESRNVPKAALVFEGQSLNLESVDENRVRIRCTKPDAALPHLLTQIPVLPRHLFDGDGTPIENYWNLETPPERMTGLGPFLIDVHTPGEKTVLKRNPHYWRVDEQGHRLPYLDGIEISYITEGDSRVLRLQSDELDLLDQVLTPENFQFLKEEGRGIEVYNAGSSSKITLLWFNQNLEKAGSETPYLSPSKRRWFSDISFRRAIDLIVNREAISRIVFLDQATPATTIVPKANRVWHVAPGGTVEANPEEARRLLSQAGYSWETQAGASVLVDTQGVPVRFELLTTPETSLNRMAAVIEQDLAALGIQISIRQEEFRAVGSRVTQSRRYDAVLASFSFPTEPTDFANVLLSKGSMHLWNPLQPTPVTEWEARIDRAMDEQRTTLDLEGRRRVFGEVLRILDEKIPVLPVVYWDVLTARQARLKNFEPSNIFPYGLWNVWELYLESESG